MKKILFLSLIAILLFSNQSFSQFNFSVSLGFKLNSATFGYKIGNITPYASLQIMNGSSTFTESGKKYDYDENQIVSYEDNLKLNGNIFLPTIGLKYSFLTKDNLDAYGTVNLVKPIFSAKIETDDDEFNQEFEDEYDELKKAIKLWGAEFAFGAEYHFDEHFSISGEFGLRHYKLKYNRTEEREIWNPDTGQEQSVDITTDFKASINPTFSKISLNFYF